MIMFMFEPSKDNEPRMRAYRELVERCLKARGDGTTMLARIDALADEGTCSGSVRRRHADRALDDVEETAVGDHVFDHEMVGATDKRV